MSTLVKVPVYLKLVEYLANLATPEQILAYKISDDVQERLEALLNKNNEGELTTEERRELDDFTEFNSYVVLLKAQAAARLKGAP